MEGLHAVEESSAVARILKIKSNETEDREHNK